MTAFFCLLKLHRFCEDYWLNIATDKFWAEGLSCKCIMRTNQLLCSWQSMQSTHCQVTDHWSPMIQRRKMFPDEHCRSTDKMFKTPTPTILQNTPIFIVFEQRFLNPVRVDSNQKNSSTIRNALWIKLHKTHSFNKPFAVLCQHFCPRIPAHL